jgi:hypothetical protein
LISRDRIGTGEHRRRAFAEGHPARSVLRHIRVASKQELKDRLLAAVDYFNGDPVVHTWTYKLDKAA